MARFTTSDGLSLYYEDEGAGQPVLCLAGLTRNARDFDFVAPHLPNVRLIRLDYRGRGESDYDPDFNNYNVLREGLDAVELLDHLGLSKAVYLGTSRGGLISMALAMTHKARMAGVILNDIGPVLDPGGIALIMTYVGRQPAAQTLDQAAAGMAAFFAEAFPGVGMDVWHAAAAAQYRETPDGLELRYDAKLRDALLAQAEAGTPADVWPLFEALRDLPTGVIRGANSNLFTADTLAEMQARHPNLVADTVPDRGHVPLLNELEALAVIAQVLEQSQ